MKKKNTKSCFTWLKNIFVSHPINKASLCLTLSMVSLVSVGFSSWMLVGGAIETGPIDVTVGNIVEVGTSKELINKTKTKNFEDAFVSIATGGEL